MGKHNSRTRNRTTAKSRAYERHLARFVGREVARRDFCQRPRTTIFAGGDPSAAALGQGDPEPRICVDVEVPHELQSLVGDDDRADTSEPDEVEAQVRGTATCTCTLAGPDGGDLEDSADFDDAADADP